MITAYIIFSLLTYFLVIYVDFYRDKAEFSLSDFINLFLYCLIPIINIYIFYITSNEIKFKRK